MSAASRSTKGPSQRSRTAGTSGHGSRTASKAGVGGAGKPAKDSGDVLKAREKEYRRLNEELEAKTAALVQEAEELMKGNISILSELESSSPNRANVDTPTTRPRTTAPSSRPKKQAPPPSMPAARPHTTTASHSRKPRTISDDVTVPGDASRAADARLVAGPRAQSVPGIESVGVDVDEDHTVLRLEGELGQMGVLVGGSGEELGYHGDDILPEAAEDMGSEALIRFLKAKLRVMQEEMDSLCQENSEKDKQLHASEAKVKELSDQNTKLQRSQQSLQSHIEKYKQTTDSLRHRCEGLEAQLVSLRKEVDGMKSAQRKAASSHGALEVRLNRALEEAEKHKTALQKARSESKDSTKQEHQRIDLLIAENKQLEKQRSELIAAFKKQMKLIDILKRQKMHFEAAKMLSFTEEEFVKALDWGAP